MGKNKTETKKFTVAIKIEKFDYDGVPVHRNGLSLKTVSIIIAFSAFTAFSAYMR